MRARERRRERGLVAVAITAVVGALVLHAIGALSGLERSSVDARFSVRGTQSAPRDVAVVGIDDRTINALRQFPFSRRYDAQMITRLKADGARVIAYDVQFTEPSADPAADQALGTAASAAHGIVLADDELERRGTNVFGGTVVPGERVGDTETFEDSDGVVRRMRASAGVRAAFAVVAARAAGRRVPSGAFGGRGAWIDFRGPNGTIPTASFVDVLHGRDAAALRGRVVVVGATAPTLQDLHATPTAPAMSGPELLATEIDTILRGFPLNGTGALVDVLLVLLLGVAAPLAAWRLGAPGAVGAGVIAAGVFLVVVQLAFDGGRILPVATPLTALAIGTVGALAVSATVAAIEREHARTVFARFAPPAVVERALAQAGDEARLGGELVEVTVLFCDLRGSTALIEAVGARRGIEVVNRYLTAMTDAILAHGGTLAGFRGDGLLAVFGAPLHQHDHARRAVAAAAQLAGSRLESVNEWMRSERLGDDLAIGVGVCSGVVMAGNVGSEERMEYTVIGDAANVAARLESMTKGSGHSVFVAHQTRVQLGPAADALDDLGELEVRGARAPVRVWTLGADLSPLS